MSYMNKQAWSPENMLMAPYEVSESPLHRFSSSELIFAKTMPPWKRAMDIVGSAIGLIVLSPLLFIVSVFIKVVSPGPVLFRQVRIGCGGVPFEIYKFRTMHHQADHSVHERYLSHLIKSSEKNDACGDPMQKLTQDQRIIKYGRFLRAFGIDELPQLFNVFLGQMSLIGPRPAIPYEVDRYKLWFRGRFDVLPGLTGLWQVSGKNRLGFNQMMRLDIQYARNRCFLLDMKILFKTPFAVLKQIDDLRIGRC